MSGPMYRAGVNPIKRRHRRWAVACLVIILVLSATIWLKHALHTTTTISPAPPAAVHNVSANTSPIQKIDESIFRLELPSDWKLQSHQVQPEGTNIYTWQNTAGNAGVRSMSVYVDSTPSTLGVNHALLVQANGGGLSVQGDVSDNCSGFTSPTNGMPATASPAKWQGQPFLCDLGNYLRDVVGTVSVDGINKVYLTGQTAGKHALFFTYTDNSINPDYSIFINALQSFQLK